MPSVTNVNENKQGLIVELDNRKRRVAKGESIDVTEAQARSLLKQKANWAAEKPHARHKKETDQ